MNAWMGYGGVTWSGASVFVRTSDLRASVRPRFVVFADTHEDYLDKCTFWMGKDGYTGREDWHNLPASRHDGSGTLSYADGAVEAHHWKEAQTRQAVQGTYRAG